MAIYFNATSKLKNGGRKAPQIDLVDFEAKLMALPDNYGDGGYESRFVTALNAWLNEEPTKCGKMFDDIFNKIQVDNENLCFENLCVGSNGIPCAHIFVGGDGEIPVHAFVYWDGKTFRAYVPTYGNSYNPRTKTAFGSEDGKPTAGTYDVSIDGAAPTKLSFATDADYEGWCEQHLEEVSAYEPWMLVDFSSRVEVR